MKLTLIYLISILCANILVGHFGPQSSIYIAFVFIGLDLTLRDSLHKTWENNHLWIKMSILILSGSIISYGINSELRNIAIASSISFFGASIVDTVTYTKLHKYSSKVRINGSNILSSITDSILFPTLAFGFPLLYFIIIGQIIAKIGGGYIWGKILKLWK